MVRDAITIHKRDNVATAIRDLSLNSKANIEFQGKIITVRTNQVIPFGHKFALQIIPQGERVIKYGEAIGVATKNIQPGEHVHTHNVISQRGR